MPSQTRKPMSERNVAKDAGLETGACPCWQCGPVNGRLDY